MDHMSQRLGNLKGKFFLPQIPLNSRNENDEGKSGSRVVLDYFELL
jgi:hypothetical protein